MLNYGIPNNAGTAEKVWPGGVRIKGVPGAGFLGTGQSGKTQSQVERASGENLRRPQFARQQGSGGGFCRPSERIQSRLAGDRFEETFRNQGKGNFGAERGDQGSRRGAEK